LTPTLIRILTQEFSKTLVQSRLSHISQSSNETVELSFFHPDRPHKHLIVCLFPSHPIIFAGTEKTAALPKPPNFCRSLRKHLEYAQVLSVESEPGSRIIRFNFKTSEGRYALVFEGIPKYPNFILLDPQDQVISALRYKNEVDRPVMPQSLYAPPPQPPKPNLWTMDAKEFTRLWEAAGKPALSLWLKNEILGTDAELSAYLESFGEQAPQEWDKTKKDIELSHFNHFTLLPGPPAVLKVFPSLSPLQEQAKVYKTASEGLENWFKSELKNHNRQTEKTLLEQNINKAIKHEKRILDKLKKDRTEALRSDQYQHWGELVMAQLHLIKFHMSQVDLDDVVRGGPDKVVVPLDPSITPLQNAQRFFKKAQKGSRGLEMVDKREKEVQQRLEELKSAQRSLPSLLTADEIKKAFQQLFPVKKVENIRPKKAKEEKVPTPNIIRNKVQKGFELCVGTSAAANEYVTFQLAQPEDLWFHVRDLPGAHVVLRRLQRDNVVSDDLILMAAKEAALHSKAKPGTKVNVSYTFKKFVKKIPGAPMGMVSMTKEKSILIEA
jgi:predicted ribosome quality control (RQC) complex YloA/Tae2 family protein